MKKTNFKCLTNNFRLYSINILFILLSFYTSQAQLIFEEGFEDGIDAWKPAPANYSFTDMSREGIKSIRFLPVAGDKRSELVINDGFGQFDWGTEYWVGFSLRIVQPTYGYGVICQHHSIPMQWDEFGSGPNSFTIKIIDDKNLEIRTSTNASNVDVIPGSDSAGWGTQSVTKGYSVGTWYDFVLHFNYALDETGFIEVWMNEEKVVDITGPTVYRYDRGGRLRTTQQYQKIGMYYGTGNESVAGELLYDAYRIWKGEGGSYADVAPKNNETRVATPVFSVPTGNYFDSQSVGITTGTEGATIRYTIDGSEPSKTNGIIYSSPVTISATTTLKAIAYKADMDNSSITSADYVILLPQPIFSPSPGTYSDTQLVMISSDSQGVTIRYTTDGSNPSKSYGTIYSAPISISESTILKTIAYNSENRESLVISGSYDIISGGEFTVYEAELLTVSSDAASTIKNPEDVNASNGSYSLLGPPSENFEGSYATYSINVSEAGTFNIKAMITTRDNRGIYQLKIDDVDQGGEINCYSEGSGTLYSEVDLGAVTLTAGEHSFSFVCIGRDPLSNQAKLGLDYLKLTDTTLALDIFSQVPEIISISPNPAINEFFVELEPDKLISFEYKISSVSGKLVLLKKASVFEPGRHSVKIDISQLRQGIYLVSFMIDEKSKIYKLIKK
ncbi:chitobiase/beta-hexosaminidase C-terminal domain-containing protein [Mariniflexile sp. HMF6888]|uniref:chitobiase/beta-hexosaminidase C-terminal domain-containing protein n=1 Tax=Mariniflexile sp. HMF6888 TaxID=3373086 RepID=UPI00378BEE56